MEFCYNRGCGLQFRPEENDDEACMHHPGVPVFHDAYKGWSCCKKQTTDFTEFLNIKGCTRSKHNNVKPPEQPKQKPEVCDDIVTHRPPEPKIQDLMERPSFDLPLTRLSATWTPSLKQEIEKRKQESSAKQIADDLDDGEVPVGTQCKNTGCKQTYLGEYVNEWECLHHPGVPIFHEGLKYWSCCKRKTTDFQAFLDQAGCDSGSHVWKKKTDGQAVNRTNCRYDWHQTGSQVVVAVYCKKYDPDRTSIEVNPIRLKVNIYFPEEDSSFNLDLELRGIIDVEQTKVTMAPTKVEISMKKAEPMSWAKLDIPRAAPSTDLAEETENLTVSQPRVDAIDLSDL